MSAVKWNKEQEQVIECRNSDLVVSASAGSGKSAVMLERVLKILNDGIPLSRVLMLSYNVAIAAELKQKLTRKITTEMAVGGAEALFLADSLDEMDNANICTIDSFCSRLIKEFFQNLNIDPNYSIMEENEQKSILKSIIDEHLERFIDKQGLAAYKLIGKYYGEKGMGELIASIINFLSSLPDPEKWLADTAFYSCSRTLAGSGIERDLLQLIKRRGELFYKGASDAKAILADSRFRYSFGEAFCILDAIMSATSYEELNSIVQDISYSRKLSKNKSDNDNIEKFNVYNRYINPIKSFVSDISELVSLDVASLEKELLEGRQIVEVITNLVGAIRDDYQSYKLNNAKFEFSDLSYYAIKLLKNDEIANVLKQRYSYICVDEFQDADYRQEYILSRIIDNNLFIVGDGKQSIYGFRMAEPRILAGKFADISGGTKAGRAIRLNQNYRSDKRVLDYVNDLFNVIMEPTFSGVDYHADEQLVAGADYKYLADSVPAVEVYLPSKVDYGKESLDQSEIDSSATIPFYDNCASAYDIASDCTRKTVNKGLALEAEYIGSKIKDMVGKVDIYDINIKEWRKVGYGNIAILARGRTKEVAYILNFLRDQGLPVADHNLNRESGSGAIDIINNIMRCVDNHKCDAYITSALLSHVGGLNYQELADIRRRCPNAEFFYEACEELSDSDERLSEFFAQLTRLRGIAALDGVYGLAHEIVYGLAMDSTLYDSGSGDGDIYVIEQFLAKMQPLKISLHDYIEAQEMESKVTYEQYMSGYADKLIQTSTIHSSKGLEYPVVFLIDVDKSFNSGGNLGTANDIILSRDYGMIVKCYDEMAMNKHESMSAKIIKAIKKDDELLESMRLLYVAMTRAKNHLFIVGGKECCEKMLPYSVGNYGSWIFNGSEPSASIAASILRGKEYMSKRAVQRECGSGNNSAAVTGQRESSAAFSDTSQSDRAACTSISSSDAAVIDNYLGYRYPCIEATKIGIKYTVTELNHDFCYEDSIDKQDKFISDEEGYEGDKRERGTNYHKIFEMINYDATTPEQVDSEIASMLASGAIGADDIVGIDSTEIARVLAMDIMRAIAYQPQLREKQFMLRLPISDLFPDIASNENVLVQGAIDLLINGDELIIIDFKKSGKSRDKLIESYSKQMELYSIAASEALGKTPDHVYIVEIGGAKLIEFFKKV